MAWALGIDVVACSAFGGETGHVVKSIISQMGIHVRGTDAAGWNGCAIR
jgi:hypothetical protein